MFFAWYGGVAVAVKKLYFRHMSDDELAEFAKEAQVLSKLNHPNVIKLVGIYPYPYSIFTCHDSLHLSDCECSGVCIEKPHLAIVT